MRQSEATFRFLAPILLPPFARKVDVTGLEHLPQSGGFVLAANHVDWLDGFFLLAAMRGHTRRPAHFLARSNNYWWTGIAVQIPQDHNGTIVDHGVELLRHGGIVANFPEGARNPTPLLLPGKYGTVRMAAAAGVPIVPVGIRCDFGQSMGQSVGWLFQANHRVSLTFGRPVTYTPPAEGMSKEFLATATEALMAVIAPLCGKSV